MFSRYIFQGRRKTIRRKEDYQRGRYVDRYPTIWLLPLVLLSVLNCLDYFFTSVILENGGTELNPIVDAVIRYSKWGWFSWKFVLVSVCSLIMCLHLHYRKVRIVLVAVCLLYLLVVGYQYVGLLFI
jgi:hypothetical protein